MTWQHVAIAAITGLGAAFGLVFRALIAAWAENRRIQEERLKDERERGDRAVRETHATRALAVEVKSMAQTMMGDRR